MSYSVIPIATIHTPFREKFAIPRQPRLASAATGEIRLQPPFNSPLAFQGLEHSSHIWVIFLFHKAIAAVNQPPRLQVRPPRLGGNRKLGVFATRSSHRPNAIGQSLVKLEAINHTSLLVSGVDLLDGTPVIDIKPYVPYADCLPEATHTLATEAPVMIDVQWSETALEQATIHQQRLDQPVIDLIWQCLSQDPKPAYQVPSPAREYGVQLWDLNVKWHYPTPDTIYVLSVQLASDESDYGFSQ